jgi:hypothetical protein
MVAKFRWKLLKDKRLVILSIAKDLLQEPITREKYGVEDPSLCSG